MNKWLLFILKISFTSAILYYIFSNIPLSEVTESIASAKASYIIFALLVTPITLYIAAYQMRILIDKQGMTLSTQDIIEINLITRFYSLFLPGSLSGGAIRWYKLSKPDKKPAQALASIAFNRLIETIMLVLVGIVFWLFDVTDWSNYVIALILIAILAGLLVTHFLVFNGTVFSVISNSLGTFDLSFIPRILRDKVSKLLHSLSKYHSLSRGMLAYIYGLNLIKHLLGILSFYLFALALGMDLSIVSVGWVRSFIVIISVIPISISGFGIREGSLIYLLQPYSVSAPDAVALSLLFFSKSLIVGVIGGLLEAKTLILPSRTKSGIKEKVSP